MNIPDGYEKKLSKYGPVIFDSGCAKPIAWGFKIISSGFDGLSEFGSIECVGPGLWVLITKSLSSEEAIKEYGPISNIEVGPRGSFKSVTYGTTMFFSKRMKPV